MKRALGQLGRRIRMLIARGVVRLVDDAGGLQSVQVELLKGEVRWLTRLQDYGFTSNPQPGADLISAAVAGARNHSVLIKVDDRRYRLRGLAPGEVAIYTDEGDSIVLRRGRRIEINSLDVAINAPLTTINGAVQVFGPVTATGAIHSAVSVSAPAINAVVSMMINGVEMNGHGHAYSWTSGSGSGVTGGPQ